MALSPSLARAELARADDAVPILLTAESMRFNDQTGLVTARGDVEITQGKKILLADQVLYDRNTDIMTAEGNVALVEEDGTVLFSNKAEITSDFAAGYVNTIRVQMPDNARFAAQDGEKIGNRFTILHRAVYSPCDLCLADPEDPPLWQIRAKKVTHDEVAKDVLYRDATLDFAGVPIFYTPYLAHPDPTVKQRSGFLAPRFGHRSEIGNFAQTPYYFALAEDQDLTLAPTFSTNDIFQLQGDYRQRFTHGKLATEFSGTYAEREDDDGGRKPDQLRGHLRADADFDLGEQWRTGLNAALTTDKNYHLLYDIPLPDVLVNRAYLEGFSGRDYAALDSFYFQDIRPGTRAEEPVVLPRVQFSALGQGGQTFGGRWSVDGGLLSLQRATEGDVLRLHTDAGWERRDVSRGGVVVQTSAHLLLAGYTIHDYPNPRSATRKFEREESLRIFPQSQLTVSYPFLRNGLYTQTVIEPVVGVILAPGVRNDPRIVNEDSRDLEFDSSNLFARNRYPGIDRIDGGSRVLYGLTVTHDGLNNSHGEVFIGQSYQFIGKTGDQSPGTGLDTLRSDYVGHVLLRPASWLDASYNFRLDQRDFKARKHDVDLSLGVPQFRPYATYLFTEQPPDATTGLARPNQEQVLYGFTSQLARYWVLGFNERRDLGLTPGPLSTNLTLTYADECFSAGVVASRDQTSRTGLDNGLSVVFQVLFKNLGGVSTSPVDVGGKNPSP